MKNFLSSKNTFTISVLWCVVVLLGFLLIMGFKNGAVLLPAMIVLSLVIGLILWILLDTRYVIKNGLLYYRSGPFRGRIEIEKIKNKFPQKPLVMIINKIDFLNEEQHKLLSEKLSIINYPLSISISAKEKTGIDELKNTLLSFVNTGALRNNETIVTNSRHYDSLLKALEEIQKVKWGLDAGISSDLMAIDIRSALYFFGEITGEVTNDELLGNIFANFCIGK